MAHCPSGFTLFSVQNICVVTTQFHTLEEKLGSEYVFFRNATLYYCTHWEISPRAGCETECVSSWASTVKGVTERDKELLEVRELRLRVISVRPRVLGRSLSFSSAARRSTCLYLNIPYKTQQKSWKNSESRRELLHPMFRDIESPENEKKALSKHSIWLQWLNCNHTKLFKNIFFMPKNCKYDFVSLQYIFS